MTRMLKTMFLVVCSVVFLSSCSDDESPQPDEACNNFCGKVGECGAPTAGCASACQGGAQDASDVSADCRAAFDSVLTCIGGLTCAQLLDLVTMGGTECSAEIAGCDAACGDADCSLPSG